MAMRQAFIGYDTDPRGGHYALYPVMPNTDFLNEFTIEIRQMSVDEGLILRIMLGEEPIDADRVEKGEVVYGKHYDPQLEPYYRQGETVWTKDSA